MKAGKMSYIMIKTEDARKSTEDLRNIAGTLSDISEAVEKIQNTIKDENSTVLRTKLSDITKNINIDKENINRLGENLSRIIEIYISTEQSLLNENMISKNISSTSINLTDADSSVFGTPQDFFKYLVKEYPLSAFLDTTGKILESGGEVLGGQLNELFAVARGVGENSFIIVNPVMSKFTAPIIKAGSSLTKIGKIGIPVIGGLLDFGGQLVEGENITDAAAKAAAHVGIGIAGGKLGFAVGAVVGSVVPGAGTAVGAAVGLLAGTVISIAGDYGFDCLYDNYKDDLVDGTKKLMNEAEEGISDFFSGIGTVFG